MPNNRQLAQWEMFKASVDYHNKIVQARFTITGLYLAATSFLANSWFANPSKPTSIPAIPMLGIIFTVVCVLLEYRTHRLLKYVGARALCIERGLLHKDDHNLGFFDLMARQGEGPDQGPHVSHTLALYILYGFLGSFWLWLLWFGRPPWVRFHPFP
jgi:hypothetical protein